MTSLSGCKAACLDTPGCNAILLTTTAPVSCYRKHLTSLKKCKPDKTIELYKMPEGPAPIPTPPRPLPPPQPPWTVSSGSDVATTLNGIFASGLGSNDRLPGVILHQFDNFGENSPTPWKVLAPSADLSDRLSASLVNSKARTVFDAGGGGGFVIHPSYNQFLCFWAVDAGTMSRKCQPPGVSESCIPGCSGQSWEGGEIWCEKNVGSTYCPWGPDHARDMVQQQIAQGQGRYNEVIVDAAAFEKNLPRSIQAVYYSGGGDTKVREVHRAIVNHFGISPSKIPLLRLDLHSGDAPFEFSG